MNSLTTHEPDNDSPPQQGVVIQITLAPEIQDLLRNAFPEAKRDSAQLELIAGKLAHLMLAEVCYLFGGRRRYLSLSHQYLEWIESIYAELLPDQDYSYDRILRHFGFPPGQAAYISRVLKDRQNVQLEQRAAVGLKEKLLQSKIEHNSLGDEQVNQMMRRLNLTLREFKLLRSLVEGLLIQDEDIADPQRIAVFPSTVQATLHIDHITLILGQYDELLERIN